MSIQERVQRAHTYTHSETHYDSKYLPIPIGSVRLQMTFDICVRRKIRFFSFVLVFIYLLIERTQQIKREEEKEKDLNIVPLHVSAVCVCVMKQNDLQNCVCVVDVVVVVFAYVCLPTTFRQSKKRDFSISLFRIYKNKINREQPRYHLFTCTRMNRFYSSIHLSFFDMNRFAV